MDKLKLLIAKKKQQAGVPTSGTSMAPPKRKERPSDAELLEDLRKRQRRPQTDTKPSKEIASIADKESEELSEAETTVISWMRETLVNVKEERREETERAVDDFEKRMQTRKFPAAVCEGLAKAVKLAESRKYKKAHETYLEVAVGNAKWPIGVKGLQVKTRGCNDLIQPVSHVLDQEGNRDILTAFKRLLSAAQAENPADDLAENVIL
jgi:hypothetical protein